MALKLIHRHADFGLAEELFRRVDAVVQDVEQLEDGGLVLGLLEVRDDGEDLLGFHG